MNSSLLIRLQGLKAIVVVLCWMFFSATPVLAFSTGPLPKADDSPKVDPFSWIKMIPDSVDAVVVLNNPAKHFLLKESNQSLRQLISIGGVLTNTQDAFDALVTAFGDDTQETMESLFSRRVLLVMDEKGTDESSGALGALSMDGDVEWAILCEVDPERIDRLLARFKPTRRSIEHGHTISAIEQGRYDVLLLSKREMVILAPKESKSLFHRVITSSLTDEPGHRSMLQGREQLLASIPQGDADWAAAWVVQVERARDGASPKAHTQQTQRNIEPEVGSAVIGLMTPSAHGMNAYFATDLSFVLPETDAPIGLLSAVGEDAVAAIAVASTPGFELTASTLQAELTSLFGSEDQSPSGFAGGPGLLLLDELVEFPKFPGGSSGNRSLGVSMYTQLEDLGGEQGETLAQRVDRVMLNVVQAFDPDQAPHYRGRFPQAIRTHQLHLALYEGGGATGSPSGASSGSSSGSTGSGDSVKPSSSTDQGMSRFWLTDEPKLSWVSTESSGSQGLITAITPLWADSAQRVRWMRTAMRTLDSIGELPQGSGVVTAGYLRPGKLFELTQSTEEVDRLFSKIIKKVSWRVSRTSFGLRGRFRFDFDDRSQSHGLGESSGKGQ